jgi:hypothetical protein
MLAAFLIVAAYLGFVAVGSQAMDPPPKPRNAGVAAEPQKDPAISVASGGAQPAKER